MSSQKSVRSISGRGALTSVTLALSLVVASIGGGSVYAATKNTDRSQNKDEQACTNTNSPDKKRSRTTTCDPTIPSITIYNGGQFDDSDERTVWWPGGALANTYTVCEDGFPSNCVTVGPSTTRDVTGSPGFCSMGPCVQVSNFGAGQTLTANTSNATFTVTQTASNLATCSAGWKLAAAGDGYMLDINNIAVGDGPFCYSYLTRPSSPLSTASLSFKDYPTIVIDEGYSAP